MLIDFSDTCDRQHWMIINDEVMGGLSQSRFELSSPATAIFSGHLSLENNGGFASIHKRCQDFNFDNCCGIILKVKGDGRCYQFRVKTDDLFDGAAYRAIFTTVDQQWQTVILNFASFCASFRGKPVPNAADLSPGQIRQVGFLLADKRQGPFRLEIAWIKAFQTRNNN